MSSFGVLGSMRRHKALTITTAIAVLVLTAWAWDLSASGRGYVAAKFDIARGHIRVLGFGLPSPSVPEFSRLLRERYGIEYRAIAGCIVSRSQMAYVEGYNAASVDASTRKWGHDVVRECMRDAQRRVHPAQIAH